MVKVLARSSSHCLTRISSSGHRQKQQVFLFFFVFANVPVFTEFLRLAGRGRWRGSVVRTSGLWLAYFPRSMVDMWPLHSICCGTTNQANSAFHPFGVSNWVIIHVITWITGVETTGCSERWFSKKLELAAKRRNCELIRICIVACSGKCWMGNWILSPSS